MSDAAASASVAGETTTQGGSGRQLSQVQVAEIRKAFVLCDVDGSGSIDRSELRGALSMLLGGVGGAADAAADVSEAEVDSLFLAMDKDGDGVITWEEFLEGLNKLYLIVFLIPPCLVFLALLFFFFPPLFFASRAFRLLTRANFSFFPPLCCSKQRCATGFSTTLPPAASRAGANARARKSTTESPASSRSSARTRATSTLFVRGWRRRTTPLGSST
jgi:Ca2+-binding EF-hand superfamily protein